MRTLFILFISLSSWSFSQHSISGKVISEGEPIEFVKIGIPSLDKKTESNQSGEFQFENLAKGKYQLVFSSTEFKTQRKTIELTGDTTISIKLESVLEQEVEEVVVSGTMKEVSKTESTVNVEVFSPAFSKRIQLLHFMMPFKVSTEFVLN